MDGPGELSAYRGDLLLGAIRKDRVISREQDALTSRSLWEKIFPKLTIHASRIALALGPPADAKTVSLDLYRQWTTAVSRLCIALRRTGTGGALLITPTPQLRHLTLHHELPYRRLQDSLILGVLDSNHAAMMRERVSGDEPTFPGSHVIQAVLAETDESYERVGVRAPHVDVSRFGTRHSSMLWYCKQDPNAIGVIVSQDGNVRVATTVKGRLVLWDDVKLLGYRDDFRRYMREEKSTRAFRATVGIPKMRGYSKMPKSLAALSRAS